MSVNRNVTTPEGRPPADTRTGCHTTPTSTGQSRLTFETLECRLFRDAVQICTDLVDLVVGIRHDGGGGHCLAFVGERFVSLVAENLTEVGNRSVDLGKGRRGERAE